MVIAGTVIVTTAAHAAATQPVLNDQTRREVLMSYHPVEASDFVCRSNKSYSTTVTATFNAAAFFVTGTVRTRAR
jgi:hypothetical protein